MKWLRLSEGLLKCGLPISVAFLMSATASGGTTFNSYTGTLATPESVFETTFTILGTSTVTFQTWGFGGGTNASDTVIPAGGFDPLIALFTGPAATATM
jgi:hypothetical protein